MADEDTTSVERLHAKPYRESQSKVGTFTNCRLSVFGGMAISYQGGERHHRVEKRSSKNCTRNIY